MEENTRIKVFALGGLCEVGKNMYCIEQDDEIAIIDSGIGFSEGDFGINVVLPDYTYLKQNEEKIVGLFITHGHEDHIGGIPFLLSEVKIPKIYANPFSIKLINDKLKDYSLLNQYNEELIEEYNSDSIYNFKNFSISFFRTNHSIPDSYGVAIKTRLGYILHTGDFKFDLTPVSNSFDYFKIATYCQEGTLLLLSDSTNALSNKQPISEKRVSASLKNQFSYIKGRIIIATFASNTVRIGQILEAANSCNRKVVIFGRSIEKSISVASSLKYLIPPKGIFVKADNYQDVNDENIVILTTGTQGEPLSSLSRIANGTHKNIKLKNGDTVIFSSSSIPGNQERINQIINKMYRYGVDVLTNTSLADVHSSGHAYASELQLMLNLTKPKYFMPIHGEYAMLAKHAELAQETGISPRNCFVLNNGDVLTLTQDGISHKTKVMCGNVYVDNNGFYVGAEEMKERRALSKNGIICQTITLTDNKLLSLPTIVSRGFIYNKTSHEMLMNILYKTSSVTNEFLENNEDYSVEDLKNYIENEVLTYIAELTGRRPILKTIIMKNNSN